MADGVSNVVPSASRCDSDSNAAIYRAPLHFRAPWTSLTMGDNNEAWIRCRSLTYHIPPNSTIRLGRSIDSDLRLLTDTAASREHCVITFLNDRLEVRDLDSLNGTAVNGQLISVPTQLRHNDVISVGETALTILFELDQDDRGTEDFRIPS